MEYNDLPIITILTPVYKRHNFLKLFLQNIKSQNYPLSKVKVIIDECKSDEPFIDNLDAVKRELYPVELTHNVYDKKETIGFKRNRLVRDCKTNIFQFFDSDDIYNPDCLLYNYICLKDNNAVCVGSDQMIFCYTKSKYKICKIDCGGLTSHIHEASVMAKKKWFIKTNKFDVINTGEGKNLFMGVQKNKIFITNIDMVMICLCHEENTIPKEHFNDTNDNSPSLDEKIVEFIETILPP